MSERTTILALIAAPLGHPKLPAPVTVYAARPVRILCGGCMEPMGRWGRVQGVEVGAGAISGIAWLINRHAREEASDG